MRNNKRRNVLTHARVNFSQSETSSLLRGGELKFELLVCVCVCVCVCVGGGGGVNRKDPLVASLQVLKSFNGEIRLPISFGIKHHGGKA